MMHTKYNFKIEQRFIRKNNVRKVVLILHFIFFNLNLLSKLIFLFFFISKYVQVFILVCLFLVCVGF